MTHPEGIQGSDAVLLAHIIALLEQARCRHHAAEFTLDRFSVHGRLATPQGVIRFCRDCGLTLHREPVTKKRSLTR